MFYKKKSLSCNLTCTATISPYGVELIKFFSGGGTKNEYFAEYYEKLLISMREKYPNKKLVFLLDNLWAHKSLLIMKIMQADYA